MKFLITGSDGQLGQEWQFFLQEIKEDFEAFDKDKLDITSPKKVKNILSTVKPDVLINCAAFTAVDHAESRPDTAVLINASGPELLAKTCSELNITLVHYSTDYVFQGSLEDRHTYPKGYKEHHPTNPLTEYGKSKLMGELAIQNNSDKHVIIRTSWLCGLYGSNFIKTMLKLANKGVRINVVQDQYGSPTFTQDLVQNSYALLKSGEYGLYHCSSKGETTWYDFAHEIFRLRDLNVDLVPVSSEEFKSKAKRPAFSLLNSEKIATIEGVKIPNWQDSLKDLMKTIEP